MGYRLLYNVRHKEHIVYFWYAPVNTKEHDMQKWFQREIEKTS